jgi:hypothetical protein
MTLANLVKIEGNTYPVKESLKALGAKWNPDIKSWMIDPAKMEQANQIVKNAPPQEKKQLTSEDFVAMRARKNGETPGVCSACRAKCKYPWTECWDCREERQMGY